MSSGEAGPDPVEITEPVDVVAWLRALPVDAVLLDRNRSAWQVGEDRDRGYFIAAGDHQRYRTDHEADMRFVAAYGPFRVLWMPPVGDAS